MTADAHRHGQCLVLFPPSTPLWSRGPACGLDESIEALFMTTFRTTAQEDIA